MKPQANPPRRWAREEHRLIVSNGRIKSILPERGFGFIQENGTAGDVFFHNSSMAAGGTFDQLKEGQTVEFEKEPDPRNAKRLRATNVRSVASE